MYTRDGLHLYLKAAAVLADELQKSVKCGTGGTYLNQECTGDIHKFDNRGTGNESTRKPTKDSLVNCSETGYKCVWLNARTQQRYVELLGKIDCGDTLDNKSVMECWNILKAELDYIIYTFIPLNKVCKMSRKKHLAKEAIRKE